MNSNDKSVRKMHIFAHICAQHKATLRATALVCLLAGFAATAVFKITPMPAPFGLDAVAAPHFAVTEARFDAALDGADGAVLVTVGFANLGTAPGAPERVVVSLLDATGEPVITRPIAVREAPLAPGGRRLLTARMSVTPERVSDIAVSFATAEPKD